MFSWFRGYAGSMNTMPRDRHYFFVLRYCRLHNALMDKGEKAHLPSILRAKKVDGKRCKSRYACHPTVVKKAMKKAC